MSSKPLVAVTGATGFIGKTLCMNLRQRDYNVRALARSAARGAELEAAGVELVIGDLEDTAALRQLCTGSTLVIHCAGAVRGNSYAEFARVNVTGTQQVLDAVAAEVVPPRLLLLSSLAAREPQLSWYSRSKREGERLLESSAGINWTIVRPPAVYGPGDKEMKAVFDSMAIGFALVPGTAESRTSLVHVDDLIEAVIALIGKENGRQVTYTVCDGRQGGYDWGELADAAAQAWGRQVRLVRVPRWLLNTVAACNLFLARITGRAAMLTPPKLRELRHPDWVVDNRLISEDTGWEPRVPLVVGLKAIADATDA